MAVDGRLFVVTENNGARLYDFDEQGIIVPQAVAQNEELAPDVSSPAVVGRRVFCVWEGLFCLDLERNLQPIWIGDDAAFCDSSPLFVTDRRVLAFGHGGELLLVDAAGPEFRIISRWHLLDDRQSQRAEPLSHPALVGRRLYLRGEKELVCAELDPAAG